MGPCIVFDGHKNNKLLQNKKANVGRLHYFCPMHLHEAISTFNLLGQHHKPFWFIVSYDQSQILVFPENQAYENGVYFHFPKTKNFPCNESVESCPPQLSFQKEPVGFQDYLEAFNKVKFHLQKGNSYLVNLTFASQVTTNWTLSQIFHQSNAKYKILYRDQFVVFSPESFIQIHDGLISTYPMKGTIDAHIENARQVLIDNEKELAEHATIVDLLRNDLSRFASQVKVEQFRYIEQITSNQKPLLQVSSKIIGQLPSNYHQQLGDIVFGMLPAGSVTGAPKPKTLEIISEAEPYKRGFYTGIAGFFDGHNLDSCVLIRFIEKTNGKLWYKSGGGITFMSKAEEEYQELIDKIYVPVN
jgi:para-aminobenzoate synthetase component I